MSRSEIAVEPSPYYWPKELATRWRNSRSNVDRIARHAKISRIPLGDGRNGMIRYPRKEVEAHEASRQFGTPVKLNFP